MQQNKEKNDRTQHNNSGVKFKCNKKCPRKKQTFPPEPNGQPLFACFFLGNRVLCGNKCGVILWPGSEALPSPQASID